MTYLIGDDARESAFRQVMNYFRQNQEEMERVIQTEVDVSIEKDGYFLVGKVDLLLGSDGKLELLDFKTSERSTDPRLLRAYEDQLCTYAHILENGTANGRNACFCTGPLNPKSECSHGAAIRVGSGGRSRA